MGYLISQICICLLLAFLLGLLIGCLLKSIFCKRKIRELEDKYERSTLRRVEKPATPVAAAKPATKKEIVKDDLKEISGVAEVMEKMLNKNGIYSYKDVAELERREVKELAEDLKGFKDRITRDDWVAQAKKLHFKKYNEKI